jgi:hypothetical protein
MTRDAEAVDLQLTRDAALVLFEWLYQCRDEGYRTPTRPEQIALSNLIGRLESTLVEPFEQNYVALVAEAASRLVERFGEAEPDD